MAISYGPLLHAKKEDTTQNIIIPKSDIIYSMPTLEFLQSKMEASITIFTYQRGIIQIITESKK